MNNANNQLTTKDTMNFDVFMSAPAVQRKVEAIVGGTKRDQFITSIVASVQTNSVLKECTNTSVFSAALVGAALNLSPSPQLGQFYMVPFNNSKKNIKEAQFILGYKGYMQLAIRSGQVERMNVIEIKEGELVKYDPLNEEIEVKLIEDEVLRETTKTIGYYAMFKLISGFKKAMYWSKDKMMIHADKYSSAFSMKSYKDLQEGKIASKDLWKYSSFWYKDFDEMARKTMLRQLISKGGCPMSTEMQSAFDKDMTIIKEDGTVVRIDEEENNKIIEVEAETEITEEKTEQQNTAVISSAAEKQKEVKEVDGNFLD